MSSAQSGGKRFDLMRLLIVSQYFWPEGFRINDLVTELVGRGHEVTVLTGVPNYPDGVVFTEYRDNSASFAQFAGADVIRVPMLSRGKGALRLILNYLSFAMSASFMGPLRLRGRQFDAIFVYEPSPITVGVPAIVMKWFKKAPIAFWVLDLWPQSLQAVGAVKSPLVLKLVNRLVRAIYSGCDLVLAQSHSFVPKIASYLPDARRVVYFPSWAETIVPPENTLPAPEVPPSVGTFDIVFAGNIGEAQDFPTLLEAAELLVDTPVRWLVVGDGRKADWVRSEIDRRGLGKSIVMLGRYPIERMPSFFRHADALLVSLKADPIFALTIPAKLQTYLAAGIPILATLDGEGAKVVEASGAGLAAQAGDAVGLALAVRRLMALDQADRREMGRRGRIYAHREFDRSELISRLEGWFEDLVAGREPGTGGPAQRRLMLP